MRLSVRLEHKQLSPRVVLVLDILLRHLQAWAIKIIMNHFNDANTEVSQTKNREAHVQVWLMNELGCI